MAKIKRIGVLTSGGDAPGMNAAIRATVRTAYYNCLEVFGIYRGYQGLIEGEIKKLMPKDVSGIIQRGGTILLSARSEEFMTPEGRKKAYDQLKQNGIDALVVIGGDGSFTGARIFAEEYDFPIVGLPGTIDNDLYGTDYTIGFDTALNTVIEAIDKIRDTASAHQRLFFIEVMGRDAGFIALYAAIATGAEAVLIPEIDVKPEELKAHLEQGRKRNKDSNIVIVAEGEKYGGAYEIVEKVKDDFKDYSIRVTVLGHIQRGGSPSAYDRVLASRMGVGAIEALLDDQQNVMIGIQNNEIVYVPFSKAIKNEKKVNAALFDIVDILSI
jgi:6-phosphofructokinase 1